MIGPQLHDLQNVGVEPGMDADQAHYGDLPRPDVREGDGDKKSHHHSMAISVPIVDRPVTPYLVVTGSPTAG